MLTVPGTDKFKAATTKREEIVKELAIESKPRQFDYYKTFIVGFGLLGLSIIWPIFNQYIPLFLQAGNPQFEAQLLAEGRPIPDVKGFALSPAIALFIMTWDNIINVFVQPWIGAKSDHTWNRFGRRKGWILLGAPIAIVGFILLPFAQTMFALAVFILITNIGMAIVRSPSAAWLGDLYRPEERSKANGIINLMGGIGSIIAFLGGGYLFEQFGRHAPFIGGALLMGVAGLIAVWKVEEPRHIQLDKENPGGVLDNLRVIWRNPDKSSLYILLGIFLWFVGFYALEAGLSSFAVFSLGISPGRASIYIGLIAASFILFAVPAGWLGTKYGALRAILYGLVGLTLVLALSYFLIQGATSLIVFMSMIGGLWASINVNSLPLLYDYGDERRIGAYTGLYYFSSQLAAVVGPTMSGVVVQQFGSQYRWLFPFSALFMALAWVIMMRVRPKPKFVPLD